MKNNIAIGLLVLLLISLYFNFKSNIYLSSLKKEENISFEQKQKCATYKKDIETKFEKDNNEPTVSVSKLERIFYSIKEKSCLYVYVKEVTRSTVPIDEVRYMGLVDALSGEVYYQPAVMINFKDDYIKLEKFNNLVKEYEFGVSTTSK